ncbi:cyclin-J-like isoform X1 [Sesbania bispinosa]|nr:cyclin-J-like isoform X1 [Sesbania bispinosa]
MAGHPVFWAAAAWRKVVWQCKLHQKGQSSLPIKGEVKAECGHLFWEKKIERDLGKGKFSKNTAKGLSFNT